MGHFDRTLPGRVRRVIYEDLIDDAEGQTRRLLDHCCLAFEASCLNVHDKARAVRTVSSEQVRQPILRQSLDPWLRFEPQLDPLKVAPGLALDGWRGRRRACGG